MTARLPSSADSSPHAATDRARLSLSCGYYDRTLPILTGLVKPEGIELILPPLRPGTSMGSPDADVYELPIPSMIIQRARKNTHLGLPIFPKRSFFQQLLLTQKDSDIHAFEDFRGRKVGLMGWYQHAMGVWLRGHLRDDFAILPQEMRWFTERPNLYPFGESTQVTVTIMPKEKSLVQMLLDGEVDVLIHEGAHRFLMQHPELRRVFPNYKELETSYYKETGCFPINHVLFIRTDIASEHPWVVASLLKAFTEASEIAISVMERNNAVVSTPWMDSLLEEQCSYLQREVYPYGLERNRAQLERLVRYLYEQELVPTLMPLEEIFAREPV